MNDAEMHNYELKLRRAAEHLAVLDEQIDDWMDGAHRYVAELDSRSGKKHVIVKVLRSALDNLAYELAVEHQRGPLPDRYFETSDESRRA
jgi:hypothetical protein